MSHWHRDLHKMLKSMPIPKKPFRAVIGCGKRQNLYKLSLIVILRLLEILTTTQCSI